MKRRQPSPGHAPTASSGHCAPAPSDCSGDDDPGFFAPRCDACGVGYGHGEYVDARSLRQLRLIPRRLYAPGHRPYASRVMSEIVPGPGKKKPDWLRVRLPGGERYEALKQTVRKLDLHTVCEEARCPNVGECWGEGTLTIMILGDTCTRGCRFCAVTTGDPRGVTDPREPENTARALAELDLAYVVLTMVDRDDLADGGAAHVARTVERIKTYAPKLLVETLVGDFAGVRADVATVVTEGRPDVFAHNVEVVPSLQRKMRDARCSWERSADVLRWAKAEGANVTKSSLMVGCGETESDVHEAMTKLREADVDVLTIGQYLRPSPKHAEVVRYVTPDEFESYRAAGVALGFAYVASGPLVRSSYRAAEAFMTGILRGEPMPASEGVARVDRYGKKTHLPIAR